MRLNLITQWLKPRAKNPVCNPRPMVTSWEKLSSLSSENVKIMASTSQDCYEDLFLNNYKVLRIAVVNVVYMLINK